MHESDRRDAGAQPCRIGDSRVVARTARCRRLGLFTTTDQLETVGFLELNFIISAGYDHRISEHTIEHPDITCINVHPSYPPYNRGNDPSRWSFVEGTPAGVSIHLVESYINIIQIIDTNYNNFKFA